MKKRRRSSAKPLKFVSIEVTVQQAESHMAARRFKEAIVAYKNLLTREPRPEWRQALVAAYRERAYELAAKQMYREAVVIWEQRLTLCNDLDSVADYVLWLIKADKIPQAARLYTKYAAERSAAFEPVNRLLALRLASGDKTLKSALSPDTLLCQHLPSINTAIEAFCQGQDDRVEQSLRAIPFRSPYKEVKQLLQLLTKLYTEPKQALSLLERLLTQQTQLTPLLQLLVPVANQNQPALVQQLGKVTVPLSQLVAQLFGASRQSMTLIQDIQQLNTQPNGRPQLFRLALKHAKLLGHEVAKKYAASQLPQYPDGYKKYAKIFGPLPPQALNRLRALWYELDGDFREAIEQWESYANDLAQSKDASARHTAAVVLSYMAKEMQEQFSDGEVVAQGFLEKSLALDPQNRDAYLLLLKVLEQQNKPKDLNRWVDQAAEQLPEDDEIVLLAARVAYRRGAFKKAAKYASQLLARDSINKSARELLVDCHLSHAFKQLGQRKHALANKELEIALTYSIDPMQRGSVELNQGWVAMEMQETVRAESLLKQGHQTLGGHLVADLKFYIDGRRMGVTEAMLKKTHQRLWNKKSPPIDVTGLMQVMALINRYHSHSVAELTLGLKILNKPLSKAATLALTETQSRLVCKSLLQVKQTKLLATYAKAALQKWPDLPIFVYYQVKAKTTSGYMGRTEMFRLRAAYDTAEDNGDKEAIKLLRELMGYPTSFAGIPHSEGGGGGAHAMLEDMLEDLLEKEGIDLPPGMDALDFMKMLEEMHDEMPNGSPNSPRGRRRR